LRRCPESEDSHILAPLGQRRVLWIQEVMPAVGEIAENSVEQEIAVDRHFPEEEWGMPQRDVEASQQPVCFGVDAGGVVSPLLDAPPAKFALLVPQIKTPSYRIGDAIVDKE
jgi:hypothetical protein